MNFGHSGGFLLGSCALTLACGCPGGQETSSEVTAPTSEAATMLPTEGLTTDSQTNAGPTDTTGESGETESEDSDGPPWPIDVQGHRGNRGNVPPGNTLPSYLSALELGVTTLEGDMQITSDRMVVMGHDDDLTTTGCVWAGESDPSTPLVSNMTSAEITSWDCHPDLDGIQAPPPVSEVLALDDLVRFNFEFKRTGSAEVDTYMQALLTYNEQCAGCLEGRMTIQSFNWGDLQYAREAYTDAVTWGAEGFRSAALGLAPLLDDIEEAGTYAEIWSPHQDIVSAEIIVQVHGLGLEVIPWTVNDTAKMQEFIDLGVDGIITDYPDILIGLLTSG